MRKNKYFIILLILLLLLTACSPKPNIDTDPPNTPDPTPIPTEPAIDPTLDISKLTGSFAFANESGKQLIVYEGLDSIAEPQALDLAVGTGGEVLTVNYVKKQEATPQNSNRQSIYNFDNLEGYLYEVKEGAAKSNETYLLTNKQAFNPDSVVKVADSSYEEAAAATLEKISTDKGRKAEKAWLLAKLDEKRTIYIVLFERQQEDMLASIVLDNGGSFAYKDYPAIYNAGSTWSVDDGGVLTPQMFKVLFAADSKEGLVLGINRLSFEGQGTFIFEEKGKTLEELTLQTYRYWAP